ncbi:hypothetical protein BU16DRAFT_540038 [Lophium mytilinum]|uniref:DUF4470 domain-containing protein n=1 Tax=Lophium mytilinum TaxID=390894 RepID=A0A6A6QS13_9PEZI|nr:hypothetical protein BU16DRAFT_540038 [Lophium mytilinum]
MGDARSPSLPNRSKQVTDLTDHRERGNALYKGGKLIQAIDAYKRACSASPEDARPLSNLSASYFETGEYDNSIKSAEAALQLLKSPDDPLRARLWTRISKAHMHADRWKEAEKASRELAVTDDDGLKSALEHAIRVEKDIETRAPQGMFTYASNVTQILPRYMPSMLSRPEYYNVGHDDCSPLLDPAIMMDPPFKETLTAMFGGIGDARHLYTTIAAVTLWEEQMKKNMRTPKYHFTCVDLKAPTMARLLIMLLLINRLPANRSSDTAQQINSTAFYVFVAPIMPVYAHQQLQKTITLAIDILEGRRTPPKWITIYELDRPALVDALKSWQLNTAAACTTAKMATIAAKGFESFDDPVPDGCELEHRYYGSSAMLLPPPTLLTDRERSFVDALKHSVNDSEESDTALVTFSEYLAQNWKPNVTLVDIDAISPPFEMDLMYNPFRVLGAQLWHVPPKELHQLFDYWKGFFVELSQAISSLRDRIVIELITGEATQILEHLKYKTLPHRRSKTIDLVNPASYPWRYDRIHLSNIPDYVGGPLTTFLYSIPVNDPDRDPYITSNVLRNNPAYGDTKNFDTFFNENLCLYDSKDLLKTMKVEKTRNILEPRDDKVKFDLSRYACWKRPDQKRMKFADLMERPSLEKWVYSIFMKITIPYPRALTESNNRSLIYSPHNVSIMFKLLIHLSEIGYPAHWLAAILSNILSGKITTRARPPRSCPLNIAETKVNRPIRTTTVAPFVADMRTQTAIWLPLMPFGFSVPDLPNLGDIYRHKVPVKGATPFWPDVPHFILVLFNDSIWPDGETMNLRQALLDDDNSIQTPAVKRFREEGIVVVSVFQFTKVVKNKAKEAAFWMDRRVIEKMLAEGTWMVGIWRNDSWCSQSDPCDLKEGPKGLKRGGCWLDVATKKDVP